MFHEIAPYKLDITYIKSTPKDTDYVICTGASGGIYVYKGEELRLPTFADSGLSKGEVGFLFKIDEMSYYRPLTKVDFKNPENFEEVTVRDLRNRKPMHLAYGATLGKFIGNFYDNNAYCGKCGGKCVHSETERAMVCTSCGHTAYPQICPSVIVLIRNGDETVLTKYQASHSAYRRYALVAGYVESGETPEEAVHREVYEEVGLKVKNVTYYKSQPWPLSGALLFGFVCDLDGDGTIVRQEDELAVAEWVKREDVPERSADVSLTSEMMEKFRTGKL